MRNKLGLALAAALLFVGAGCASGVSQQASVNVGDTGGMKEQGDGSASVNADANVNADVNVDTEVDAILKSADDEKSAALDTEADASQVGTDGSDVDAMINASYAD